MRKMSDNNMKRNLFAADSPLLQINHDKKCKRNQKKKKNKTKNISI